MRRKRPKKKKRSKDSRDEKNNLEDNCDKKNNVKENNDKTYNHKNNTNEKNDLEDNTDEKNILKENFDKEYNPNNNTVEKNNLKNINYEKNNLDKNSDTKNNTKDNCDIEKNVIWIDSSSLSLVDHHQASPIDETKMFLNRMLRDFDLNADELLELYNNFEKHSHVSVQRLSNSTEVVLSLMKNWLNLFIEVCKALAHFKSVDPDVKYNMLSSLFSDKDAAVENTTRLLEKCLCLQVTMPETCFAIEEPESSLNFPTDDSSFSRFDDLFSRLLNASDGLYDASYLLNNLDDHAPGYNFKVWTVLSNIVFRDCSPDARETGILYEIMESLDFNRPQGLVFLQSLAKSGDLKKMNQVAVNKLNYSSVIFDILYLNKLYPRTRKLESEIMYSSREKKDDGGNDDYPFVNSNGQRGANYTNVENILTQYLIGVSKKADLSELYYSYWSSSPCLVKDIVISLLESLKNSMPRCDCEFITPRIHYEPTRNSSDISCKKTERQLAENDSLLSLLYCIIRSPLTNPQDIAVLCRKNMFWTMAAEISSKHDLHSQDICAVLQSFCPMLFKNLLSKVNSYSDYQEIFSRLVRMTSEVNDSNKLRCLECNDSYSVMDSDDLCCPLHSALSRNFDGEPTDAPDCMLLDVESVWMVISGDVSAKLGPRTALQLLKETCTDLAPGFLPVK